MILSNELIRGIRRAHGDVTATNYSFADVIKSNESSSPALLALKQHCLHPGRYQLHIVNWLKYFPLSHLHFIDGDELVIHPAIVMATLQRFLQVEEVNYINILRYSVRKHHFCVAGSDGKTNCLGPSKGRLYPQLTKSERKALEEYYYADNMKLVSLLRKLNVPLPTWLKQTLS